MDISSSSCEGPDRHHQTVDMCGPNVAQALDFDFEKNQSCDNKCDYSKSDWQNSAWDGTYSEELIPRFISQSTDTPTVPSKVSWYVSVCGN